MKTEIKLDEAIGKTVENYAFGAFMSSLVITFTDGTFACVNAKVGTYEDDAEMDEDGVSMTGFGNHELIRVGIATADELHELSEKREAEHKAWQEERDLAEFRRLADKFGAVK